MQGGNYAPKKETDGTAYLKLEAVARGLGFTTVAASGNEVVRWNTVHKYLMDLGVATSCNGGGYRDSCPNFIPENIFYRLAMKAKNETAERFQAFVADEVIPSIRKHGGYIAGQGKMSDAELLASALLVAQRTLEERETRIAALEGQIQADAAKVVFANAVSASSSSILIGELAKLLTQNGVKDMGQNRLFKWLRENGFLIQRKGTDYNMPSQKAMEMGLFRVKETAITHSDGHVTVSKTPKVTGTGQSYFLNRFLREKEASASPA